MENLTFEDFLKDWHAKYYHGTDDDMPDAYEAWLYEVGTDGIIRLADVFGKEMEIRGIKHVGEIALNAMKA